MEAIGIVMPIENRMANAYYFTGCPSILCVAIIIVITLYSLVGSVGFLKFGSDARATLTLNLPDNEIYAQLTQVFIAIAVYLTVALNFFVTTEVFWRLFNHRFPEKKLWLAHIIYRWALITMIFILALFIPKLEYIIVIISSLFIAALGMYEYDEQFLIHIKIMYIHTFFLFPRFNDSCHSTYHIQMG